MKFAAAALIATASANQYDFMGEDELLSQLSSTHLYISALSLISLSYLSHLSPLSLSLISLSSLYIYITHLSLSLSHCTYVVQNPPFLYARLGVGRADQLGGGEHGGGLHAHSEHEEAGRAPGSRMRITRTDGGH